MVHQRTINGELNLVLSQAFDRANIHLHLIVGNITPTLKKETLLTQNFSLMKGPAPIWLIDALQNDPLRLGELLKQDPSIATSYYAEDVFGFKLGLSFYAWLGKYPIQSMTLLLAHGLKIPPFILLMELVNMARPLAIESAHLRMLIVRMIKGCRQDMLNESLTIAIRKARPQLACALVRAGATCAPGFDFSTHLVKIQVLRVYVGVQNYATHLATTRAALVVLLGLKRKGLRFGAVPKEVIRQIAQCCWSRVDDDERFAVGDANKRAKV